jgi:hypothetical protein
MISLMPFQNSGWNGGFTIALRAGATPIGIATLTLGCLAL